jgi:hypothetical protein
MDGADGEPLWRPVPDPTVLTTEALMREVAHTRELVDAKLVSLGGRIDERFRSIDEQFDLVENRRVEQKSDTKAAVDAALQAAKEAVQEQKSASDLSTAKTESGFSEQLKQLSETFSTALAGITRSIDDLKERIVTIESTKAGGQQAYTVLYLIAVVALAAASVVVAVLVKGP